MNDVDYGQLIYLALLGSAIVLWFVAQNRASLGKVTQQALVWVLIFIGVIAAVGLWDDIRQNVAPRQAVVGDGDRIELPRAPDGHYYLIADVNGRAIEFVVDTGATDIVLNQSDARAVGLAPEGLDFIGTAYTANGPVRTAPVRLDQVSIGGIVDTDVRAVVNEGELSDSLLGMSYLQRYASVEISGGKMILTRGR